MAFGTTRTRPGFLRPNWVSAEKTSFISVHSKLQQVSIHLGCLSTRSVCAQKDTSTSSIRLGFLRPNWVFAEKTGTREIYLGCLGSG